MQEILYLAVYEISNVVSHIRFQTAEERYGHFCVPDVGGRDVALTNYPVWRRG